MVNPIYPTSADTGSAFLKTTTGYINATFIRGMAASGEQTTVTLDDGTSHIVEAPIDTVAAACGKVTAIVPPPAEPGERSAEEARVIAEAVEKVKALEKVELQTSSLMPGPETWGEKRETPPTARTTGLPNTE